MRLGADRQTESGMFVTGAWVLGCACQPQECQSLLAQPPEMTRVKPARRDEVKCGLDVLSVVCAPQERSSPMSPSCAHEISRRCCFQCVIVFESMCVHTYDCKNGKSISYISHVFATQHIHFHLAGETQRQAMEHRQPTAELTNR
jgi:hypothetical protein